MFTSLIQYERRQPLPTASNLQCFAYIGHPLDLSMGKIQDQNHFLWDSHTAPCRSLSSFPDLWTKKGVYPMIKLEVQDRFMTRSVYIHTYGYTWKDTHIYMYVHAVGHMTNGYLSVLDLVYKYLCFCSSTCWGMWTEIQSLGIWDKWMCSLFLCGWAYGFQITHKYIWSQFIYHPVSLLKADPPDTVTLQLFLLRNFIFYKKWHENCSERILICKWKRC